MPFFLPFAAYLNANHPFCRKTARDRARDDDRAVSTAELPSYVLLLSFFYVYITYFYTYTVQIMS